MRRFTIRQIVPQHLGQYRVKTTGFNVFTQETQRKSGILKAKSLREGNSRNMQIMSQLWWKLTPRRRTLYNEAARRKHMMKGDDSVKKNNSFNLVMQLLSQDSALLSVGDEKFTAMLAKRTSQALSGKHLAQVRMKLNIEPKSSVALTTRTKFCRSKREQTYWRMVCPSMCHFSSFTEMQHSIAPTQKSLYICVSKMLAKHFLSRWEHKALTQKFHTLNSEELALFSPVSFEEAPLFEAFCAANCAGFDPEHFSIIPLFALFRGIVDTAEKPSKNQVSLFRGIAATDRVRDSVYFKCQRCLEKAKLRRSSDCGVYLYNNIPEKLVVRSDAYLIHAGVDDVEVAMRLVGTRMGQSVYDDVLQRVSMLRSKDKQKLLGIYVVDEAVPRASVPVYIETKNSRKHADTDPDGNPVTDLVEAITPTGERAVQLPKTMAARKNNNLRPKAHQDGKRTRSIHKKLASVEHLVEDADGEGGLGSPTNTVSKTVTEKLRPVASKSKRRNFGRAHGRSGAVQKEMLKNAGGQPIIVLEPHHEKVTRSSPTMLAVNNDFVKQIRMQLKNFL